MVGHPPDAAPAPTDDGVLVEPAQSDSVGGNVRSAGEPEVVGAEAGAGRACQERARQGGRARSLQEGFTAFLASPPRTSHRVIPNPPRDARHFPAR